MQVSRWEHGELLGPAHMIFLAKGQVGGACGSAFPCWANPTTTPQGLPPGSFCAPGLASSGNSVEQQEPRHWSPGKPS